MVPATHTKSEKCQSKNEIIVSRARSLIATDQMHCDGTFLPTNHPGPRSGTARHQSRTVFQNSYCVFGMSTASLSSMPTSMASTPVSPRQSVARNHSLTPVILKVPPAFALLPSGANLIVGYSASFIVLSPRSSSGWTRTTTMALAKRLMSSSTA